MSSDEMLGGQRALRRTKKPQELSIFKDIHKETNRKSKKHPPLKYHQLSTSKLQHPLIRCQHQEERTD
ncbi:hypothetical protein RB195_009660 [Necator americanus]|uniref:Uncharacterized protein n=1 Tax=Necator americanus TaxID=51031 RepID=A0ABR1CVJ1_NECAM